MMSAFVTMRRAAIALAILASAVLGTSPSARADSLTRAAVTIDAREPLAPLVEARLTWTAGDGAPRSTLRFWLAPGVEVDSVTSGGSPLRFARAAETADDPSRFVGWDVTLPVPLEAGQSREMTATTRPGGAESAGIHFEPDGGVLLPGGGWLPRSIRESGDRLAATIDFRLPDGWTGVGPGAAAPGRPWAAWGEFQRVEVPGTPEVIAWRRADRTGDVPRIARVRELLAVLKAGLGPAVGDGPWQLVDVGDGPTGGGTRALFWDEGAAAAAPSEGAPSEMHDRVLGAGLAPSFWTETLRFTGPYAHWLEAGFERFFGDATVIALDPSENRIPIERRLIGSRRSAFLEGIAGDRALLGLESLDPAAPGLLDGRGALIVHHLSACAPELTGWMDLLSVFRRRKAGQDMDWAELLAFGDQRFRNQFTHAAPLLDSVALPDFRIVSHGPPTDGRPDRYRVEVENVGEVGCPVDVATFTPGGQPLRNFRSFFKPGQKRAVLFLVSDRAGSVEIDPRGELPQAHLEDEYVQLLPCVAPEEEEPLVPSYAFHTRDNWVARVDGFAVELSPGVRIEGFDGWIQWYSTHHGPSGAALMGRGLVVMEPVGALAEAFAADQGKPAREFAAEELWIRFPPERWDEMAPLLGEYTNVKAEDLRHRARRLFQFSFPTYFESESRATLPPPGAALVTFGLGADERRGLVLYPNRDGTSTMRLWDHHRGTTIWEATR